MARTERPAWCPHPLLPDFCPRRHPTFGQTLKGRGQKGKSKVHLMASTAVLGSPRPGGSDCAMRGTKKAPAPRPIFPGSDGRVGILRLRVGSVVHFKGKDKEWWGSQGERVV